MKLKDYIKDMIMLVGVVVVVFFAIGIISAFVSGMSSSSNEKTDTWTPTPTPTPPPYSIKFNKGVEAYNQGINLFNDAVNTSSNTKSYSTTIAKAEIAKSFYDDAHFYFNSALGEAASENKLKRADALAKSADYYSKGIEEMVSAYRMYDETNNNLESSIGEAALSLLVGRVPDLSKLQGSPEAKIKMEKALTYFKLGQEYANTANEIV